MRRGSTTGRPRKVTDEQVAAIMRRHEAIQALKVLHAYLMPVRTFASHLGVTTGAISTVIRQRGEYKQVCPSLKARE
jgi:hypothetical protein